MVQFALRTIYATKIVHVVKKAVMKRTLYHNKSILTSYARRLSEKNTV